MLKEAESSSREYVIIRATSYLSGRTGEELEKELERHLGEGKRHFVINFEETEIINSIGISILIGLIERIMSSKGSLRFANLSQVNEEIFRMMGLLKYAPIMKEDN